MQRRHFSLSLLAGISVSTGLTSLPAFANTPEPAEALLQENKTYQVVSPAQPNEAPAGKVQVIEFFAYSCSHCFEFETTFSNWATKAPQTAHIQRLPVSFDPIALPHARIYYTLEILKRLDLHEKVFHAFRVQKIRLIEEGQIKEFFASQGLNADEAMRIYSSFGVQAKVNRANQMVAAYKLQATPAVGVGGKYLVMGAGPQTLPITEALLQKFLAA